MLQPIDKYMRVVTGLVVLVCLARINASSFPTHASPRQADQRHSRETEAEVAHWSAQLKSSDQEERRDAAVKLSGIDGDAALAALTSAVTDVSPGVRALVLAALGERSDISVVALVAARLSSDKDAFVRKTAAYALAGFPGTGRTTALIAALKDKDQEVRGAAAVALGDHPDAAAVEPLAASLLDKSYFVRAQAARALGINRGAAAQAVPTLIRLLASDSDPEVKRCAATALGSIADRSALPALERASQDRDTYLAQDALDSIRKIQK
jgi:HEAT repeat protein